MYGYTAVQLTSFNGPVKLLIYIRDGVTCKVIQHFNLLHLMALSNY